MMANYLQRYTGSRRTPTSSSNLTHATILLLMPRPSKVSSVEPTAYFPPLPRKRRKSNTHSTSSETTVMIGKKLLPPTPRQNIAQQQQQQQQQRRTLNPSMTLTTYSQSSLSILSLKRIYVFVLTPPWDSSQGSLTRSKGLFLKTAAFCTTKAATNFKTSSARKTKVVCCVLKY